MLDARRAELQRAGRDSRAHWRADERDLWLTDLVCALDVVSVAVGAAEPEDDEERVDPREALVELMAVAAGWAEAMDGAS